MSRKLVAPVSLRVSPRRTGREHGRGNWSGDNDVLSMNRRPSVAQPRHTWYMPCKRFLDLSGAAVLLLVAGPVMLLAALLVRLTSRGPAFYSQVRVGEGGKHFTIYKLRTMVHNCESLTGARWAIPGDPRITPIGAFLRASHLDELPQLWNVLRGDMSLIGPRPERPEFLPDLERALPTYTQRLGMKPGITGLAQVQLPPDSDIESVRRKLTCDLQYIREVNPWLDLQILICTGFKAVGAPVWLAQALTRLPRWRTFPPAVARAEEMKPLVPQRKAA